MNELTVSALSVHRSLKPSLTCIRDSGMSRARDTLLRQPHPPYITACTQECIQAITCSRASTDSHRRQLRFIILCRIMPTQLGFIHTSIPLLQKPPRLDSAMALLDILITRVVGVISMACSTIALRVTLSSRVCEPQSERR